MRHDARGAREPQAYRLNLRGTGDGADHTAAVRRL